MRRLRTYIACPLSKGDLLNNIVHATQAFANLAAAGFAPFCPAWSCFSGDISRIRTGEDDFTEVIASASALGCLRTHGEWLAIDFEWVKQSDAILRLPGESKGADAECAVAFEHGIPIFETVAELIAWRDSLPKDHPDRVVFTTPRRLRSIATVLESRMDDRVEHGCSVRPMIEKVNGIATAYMADLDEDEPVPFSIPDGVP